MSPNLGGFATRDMPKAQPPAEEPKPEPTPAPEVLCDGGCENPIDIDEVTMQDFRIGRRSQRLRVCDDCLKCYSTCTHCNFYVADDDTISYGGDALCQRCYEDHYFRCDGCTEVYHNDDAHSGENGLYCESCYDDIDSDDTYIPTREQRGSIGTTTPALPLTFGLEVECHGSRNPADAPALAKWGITTDGSLRDDGREFVSPILAGPDGMANVRLALTALSDHSWDARDDRCGLHVHFGALTDAAASINAWMAFESITLGLVETRRHTNSTCKPIVGSLLERMLPLGKPGIEELNRRIYARYNLRPGQAPPSDKYLDMRYHALNVHALAVHGTLEVRCHEGTLDADEVEHWTRWCMAVLAYGQRPDTGKPSWWRSLTEFAQVITPTEANVRAAANILGVPDATLMWALGKHAVHSSEWEGGPNADRSPLAVVPKVYGPKYEDSVQYRRDPFNTRGQRIEIRLPELTQPHAMRVNALCLEDL